MNLVLLCVAKERITFSLSLTIFPETKKPSPLRCGCFYSILTLYSSCHSFLHLLHFTHTLPPSLSLSLRFVRCLASPEPNQVSCVLLSHCRSFIYSLFICLQLCFLSSYSDCH
ncbi:hypothetical protein RJT34_23463 [Clitoria ternatea]|uniref:Uncharacterized protein n=1 Tax=Clitoria ternatea TaxID=43366 RepID=A0AAN9FLP6_CLITE